MIRSLASPNSTLVRPSSRPSESERLGLGLVLDDADPGDLGTGVRDRWDELGVEKAVPAGRHLDRDLALVHRLVRQHRLADDVAEREDVGHVGAHLLVGRDEAALVHQDTRVLGADQPAVGPSHLQAPPPNPAARRRPSIGTWTVIVRPSSLSFISIMPQSARLMPLERLQRAPDSLDPQPGLELGHSW
jgi:hypothetical protein